MNRLNKQVDGGVGIYICNGVLCKLKILQESWVDKGTWNQKLVEKNFIIFWFASSFSDDFLCIKWPLNVLKF